MIIRTPSIATDLYRGTRRPSVIRLSPEEYISVSVAAISPIPAVSMNGTRNQVGSGRARYVTGFAATARLASLAASSEPKTISTIGAMLDPITVHQTSDRELVLRCR